MSQCEEIKYCGSPFDLRNGSMYRCTLPAGHDHQTKHSDGVVEWDQDGGEVFFVKRQLWCVSEYKTNSGRVHLCNLPKDHSGYCTDDVTKWPLAERPVDAKNKDLTKGPLEDEIRAKCTAIADMLCAKNRAYGNSALEPVRVFARDLDETAQIRVRIDDKLSRLRTQLGSADESLRDTTLDLIGYLVLLEIAQDRKSSS